MDDNKISFCETCTREGNGMSLSESEARIHKDNYPDHLIVKVGIDDDLVQN